MKQNVKYIRWFKEIKIGDIPSVGGKNASLGEMYHELTSQGIKIPNEVAPGHFGLAVKDYTHREKIRRKLNITNEKVNLATFLQSNVGVFFMAQAS